MPIKRAPEDKKPSFILGINGSSGAGKTYTALVAATEIAQGKRIIYIDTENRAANYKKTFDFELYVFEPPYDPTEITNFVGTLKGKDDIGCVVVDSASFLWNGDGGILAMAESQNSSKGLSKWIRPKGIWKKWCQDLAGYGVPLILCFRAEQKTITRHTCKVTGRIMDHEEVASMGWEDKKAKVNSEIMKSGVLASAGKEARYELSHELTLADPDRPGVFTITKSAEIFDPHFTTGGVFTEGHARVYRDFLDGTLEPISRSFHGMDGTEHTFRISKATDVIRVIQDLDEADVVPFAQWLKAQVAERPTLMTSDTHLAIRAAITARRKPVAGTEEAA